MKHYTIYVVLFGPSAKNAGIITDKPATRSSWSTGRLTYEVYNDGRLKFELDARDDISAFTLVSKMFAEQTRSKKPLSGRSYVRYCRAK